MDTRFFPQPHVRIENGMTAFAAMRNAICVWAGENHASNIQSRHHFGRCFAGDHDAITINITQYHGEHVAEDLTLYVGSGGERGGGVGR